jgi:5S rRNA maturation endonuclease (ribonuclease M5)
VRWSDYRNRILAEIDNEAFFLNELNNVQRRGNEVKAECPFKDLHESRTDNNPSLTVNLDKGVYYCNSCQSRGNIHTMYKQLYNVSNEEAWFALGDALKIPRPDGSKPTRPEIEPGLVREYHQKLMSLTGPLRDMLRERRGLTDETLKKFQLGWDGDRITIPIYDEFNTLVNFRRYKWNSNEDQWKVLNYVDEFNNSYGEVRIFGIDKVTDPNVDYIVWCEGEMDRLTGEQNGFHCACATSGAGTWKPDWTKLFRNKKRVYIAQDNDEAGRNATKKLCEKLYHVVDVYIIQWPEQFPVKGDVTDFFVKCGLTADDFQNLLDNAVKYVDETVTDTRLADEVADVPDVSLSTSADADYVGKRIRVPVMVSGKDSTPYVCPRQLKARCGEAAGESKKCGSCALAINAGEMTRTLTSRDAGVMKLIKCSDGQQQRMVRELLGIHPTCQDCIVDVESSMNLEELRLIPKAEANFGFSKEHDYVVRTGYYVGSNLKTNRRYTMVGYMYPEPNTQYATYMFDQAIPEKDLIGDFTLDEEALSHLQLFKQKPGQTVLEKFNEIHRDLERNVTYIWERRQVAFAVDLIYHTVLNFYFQEQYVKRGWGELLIIGDSGQAKTTIVERIMHHYRLGELHSGESSKRTGLVYSMQQTNKRWFLVWGAFPLNDGGLLTIDELSGLSEDDLGVMSDVRSSGIARATGVITAETTSRTRAIFISNPRNGRQLNSETYGVSAVLKLMGKAEDVRRLDIAMSVASGDVDPALVNRPLSDLPDVKHVYTSDVCNTRVLWAWSRKPEDIVFTDEATARILQRATEMGAKYSSSIPVVEAADQRIKIARLSVAAACCVFSSDETGQKVIVKPEHVDFVVDFMNECYSSKSFGYDKLSEQATITTNTSDDNIQRLRKAYLLLPITDFNDMSKVLYQLPYFSRATLEDYTGLSKDDLKMLLKYLTNNHLVDKVRGDYRRLPLGTKLLENLVEKPVDKSEIDAARKEAYAGADY